MTEVNPALYKELQDSYSDIRIILSSFPPEFDECAVHTPTIKEYDKKITTTYGLVEDLQKKIGKILDDIQRGDYD